MGAFCIGYTIIRYRAFSKISTIIIQWIFGLFWMVAWFWVSEVVYSLFQVFSGVLSFGVPSCDYLRSILRSALIFVDYFALHISASFYTFLIECSALLKPNSAALKKGAKINHIFVEKITPQLFSQKPSPSILNCRYFPPKKRL